MEKPLGFQHADHVLGIIAPDVAAALSLAFPPANGEVRAVKVTACAAA